jgi:hypothetical protein
VVSYPDRVASASGAEEVPGPLEHEVGRHLCVEAKESVHIWLRIRVRTREKKDPLFFEQFGPLGIRVDMPKISGQVQVGELEQFFSVQGLAPDR